MSDGPAQKNTLSSLQLRILSAAVLAPIAIVAVFLGGFYFSGFLIIAAMVMCFEWSKVSFRNNKASYCILIAIWLLVTFYLNFEGQQTSAYLSLLICAICIFILTLLRKGGGEWKGAGVGPLYIGVPILCLMNLRAIDGEGLALTAILFFVVWATDTGAYFAGRTIGGPKIAVSISPNKTWAGLIGGMISAAVVSSVSVTYFIEQEIPVWQTAGAGALFAVFAQIGDFAESAWKRHFEIKDASNVIPGHGGVLDRLDGVLFVAPALYLIVSIAGI